LKTAGASVARICSMPKTYSPKNLEILGVVGSTWTLVRSLSFFNASNLNCAIVVIFLTDGSKIIPFSVLQDIF
jgi:hypothetical protein